MREGRAGQKTAPRRALHEPLLEQEGLDDLLDGVARFAERGGDCLNSDRSPAKSFGDQLQIAAIESVEASFVDLEPCQRFVGCGGVDAGAAGDRSKVSQPLKEPSRDTRRTARPRSDLARAVFRQLEFEHARATRDDLEKLVRRIE